MPITPACPCQSSTPRGDRVTATPSSERPAPPAPPCTKVSSSPRLSSLQSVNGAAGGNSNAVRNAPHQTTQGDRNGQVELWRHKIRLQSEEALHHFFMPRMRASRSAARSKISQVSAPRLIRRRRLSRTTAARGEAEHSPPEIF